MKLSARQKAVLVSLMEEPRSLPKGSPASRVLVEAGLAYRMGRELRITGEGRELAVKLVRDEWNSTTD